MSTPREKIEEMSAMSGQELQEYLNTEPLKGLHAVKLYSDDIYYNTGQSSGLTDWQYDILKDTLERRDPDYVVPIGAKIREGENRVKLPYWLGSMDKIKTDPEFQDMDASQMEGILTQEEKELSKLKAEGVASEEDEEEEVEVESRIEKTKKQISELRTLDKWKSTNKGPYLLEDKLDGVSCLLIHKGGKIKLYTRGDGVIGANISYLAPYFATIPKNLTEEINVRGELIMPTDVFKKKWANKYANPRNLVAGRTGAKTVKEGIRDIKFIAYEMVGKGKMPKPSKQFSHLQKLGFTVVKHERVEPLSLDLLAKTFVKWKGASPYEIDGVIIQPDRPYIRNKMGNPSYAIAFKMRVGDNLVDAKVVRVLWGISKGALLKPRVQFEPVQLMGSTVTYATGVHAKYILKNKIGPGAIVKLTKSGETIPNILGVVESAKEPDFPKPPCVWKWDKNKVNIIGIENCGELCVKLILAFLQKLRFKGFGPKRVERLYGGGLNSILHILTATYEQFREVGFGKKTSTILLNSVRETLAKGIPLAKVLGASDVLGNGMGSKKVATLLDAYPNILTEQKGMTYKQLYAKVLKVSGFGTVLSSEVAKNLPWAAKFAQAMSYLTTFVTKKKVDEGPLKGYTVIITGTLPGYSRKQAAALVEESGGELAEKVKKPKAGLQQIVVVAPNPGGGKVKAAEKYGLKKHTPGEFFAILKEGIPK
jgi:DNA ligase (NAD+)